jgi:hypothetical protein
VASAASDIVASVASDIVASAAFGIVASAAFGIVASAASVESLVPKALAVVVVSRQKDLSFLQMDLEAVEVWKSPCLLMVWFV